MVDLTILTTRQALFLVALNTLLHEIGVPLPLTPTVLLVGAGSVSGGANPLALIATVIIGTLAGNSVWFAAGRRYGSRTLKFLCRISLSPDSCVTRTEGSFGRWGWSSIVVGRFIPGVSLLAPPLAGALGMSWSKFIALSAAGAALWGLVVVGTGMLLHDQLATVIQALAVFGRQALAAVILLIATYIGWRWWRRRASRGLKGRRVTVDELKALIDRGEAPLVVDVRATTARLADPRRILNAVAIEPKAIEDGHIELPRDRDIVLYCACPNEASAAQVAGVLLARGYSRARLLLGGLEAWTDAGYPIDPLQPPHHRTTTHSIA